VNPARSATFSSALPEAGPRHGAGQDERVAADDPHRVQLLQALREADHVVGVPSQVELLAPVAQPLEVVRLARQAAVAFRPDASSALSTMPARAPGHRCAQRVRAVTDAVGAEVEPHGGQSAGSLPVGRPARAAR
jgi:hypothetical protein